jgi:class 3 adenylate cyclase
MSGTDHSFRIHIGLCCGPLDSEIFEAPVHQNMQRLYHYVGGDAMCEIGELVDLAKPGETCISRNCCNFLEGGGTYDLIRGHDNAMLLRTLQIDDNELLELMDWHVQKCQEQRVARRDRNMEEDFIHSKVLDYLHHGGTDPTQVAQMRNLCVLFIAMTSQGSSVNWLMEVQAVLDKNRCPIVQIIHDDKGVHIVAAVNLYEAVPEASIIGLEVCRELRNQRVGAAVGVAIGPVFCGVTGSQHACRWDITGPSVVRAARLMQYALTNAVDFAMDQSVYNDPMAATRMWVHNAAVSLKGTHEPVAVYTLSDSESFSAFRILGNNHGAVHNESVQEIQNHISHRNRSAVLITGIPLSGMVMVCQRAAGYSDLVPYLHLCEASAGFLQLARTIATWFLYADNREVCILAKNVMQDLSRSCWSCAHDQCVRLVDVALEKGYQACFVVDRIHDLDRFSISLIRECLQDPVQRRRNDVVDYAPTTSFLRQAVSSSDQIGSTSSSGQICFLCTHLSLYSSKSANDLVQDIVRSHTSFNIAVVSLGESSKAELRLLIRDLFDLDVGERWLEAYAESSGYCAEYFLERTEAVRNKSAELWKDGKDALVEISDDLVMNIPEKLMRRNKDLKVTQIRAEIAMRFSQIFDEIPPLCQLILKVITIATRRGFYKVRNSIVLYCVVLLVNL